MALVEATEQAKNGQIANKSGIEGTVHAFIQKLKAVGTPKYSG